MANNEKSKLKTLLIYDYFLRNASPCVEKEIQISDIIRYLNQYTDTTFERKSVYADINRVNEFMRISGKTKGESDNWIYVEGKKYRRGEIKDELTIDEARLIVDAINATPFVDSGLSEKIRVNYPLYFENYRSLVPHPNSTNKDKYKKYKLNNIRSCIEREAVMCISYGYNVAGAFRGVSQRYVSPCALDWENNYYYLLAVDNEIYDRQQEKDPEKALRRFRVDRISKINIREDVEFIKLAEKESERNKLISDYVKNAIDAFSSEKVSDVRIKIKADNEKNLLRAFSALADDITIKTFISDRTDSGEIEIEISAGMTDEKNYVPTLFSRLFMLLTFENVTIEIKNRDVREQFRQYLQRGLNCIDESSDL